MQRQTIADTNYAPSACSLGVHQPKLLATRSQRHRCRSRHPRWWCLDLLGQARVLSSRIGFCITGGAWGGDRSTEDRWKNRSSSVTQWGKYLSTRQAPTCVVLVESSLVATAANSLPGIPSQVAVRNTKENKRCLHCQAKKRSPPFAYNVSGVPPDALDMASTSISCCGGC